MLNCFLRGKCFALYSFLASERLPPRLLFKRLNVHLADRREHKPVLLFNIQADRTHTTHREDISLYKIKLLSRRTPFSEKGRGTLFHFLNGMMSFLFGIILRFLSVSPLRRNVSKDKLHFGAVKKLLSRSTLFFQYPVLK